MMEKFRKRVNMWNDGTRGPRKGDWIAAFVFIAIMTFFFCFLKDFKLTVTQSLTFDSCLLNGLLKDFYTIVNKQALSGYYDSVWGKNLSSGANYSIINYATLGIICLPFYIIGKVLHVAIPFLVYELLLKLLFTAAVFYLTKVLADICKEVSMKAETTKWVSFCFLTSPILWYGLLMISQMDIFALFFMVLGLRAWLQGKKKWELAFYAIAAFYKPLVLIGLVPLFLLREKRIIYILRDCLVSVAGLLLQQIFYGSDPGYQRVQKYMSGLYSFWERLFNAGIPTTRNVYTANSSYFILLFVLICIVAYSIKKVTMPLAFGLPMLSWLAFILFVQWHPNWLVYMVPFAVIMLGFSYRKKLFCLIECFFSIFWLAVCALGWLFNYDNDLINGGVISQLAGLHTDGGDFGTIYPILVQKMAGIPVDLYISLLTAALVGWMAATVMDLYRHWRGVTPSKEMTAFERGPVLLRSLPMILFMLYSFANCFIS